MSSSRSETAMRRVLCRLHRKCSFLISPRMIACRNSGAGSVVIGRGRVVAGLLRRGLFRRLTSACLRAKCNISTCLRRLNHNVFVLSSGRSVCRGVRVCCVGNLCNLLRSGNGK